MALTASTKTPFSETLDDTDLFFLSMSIITKKLPKTEQVQIKLALSNSVLSAELRANNGQSFFYLHRQQVGILTKKLNIHQIQPKVKDQQYWK